MWTGLAANPERIIVRCPNWLGDVVMATPVFEALRGRYARAHVTALCEGKVGEVLAGSPFIDRVLALPKPKGFGQRRRQVAMLRDGRYDLSILLTHSFRTAWMFFRGRCRNRIGYATDGRFWLLSKAVPLPRDFRRKHLVHGFLDVLRPLGIEVASPRVRLAVSKDELAAARARYDELGVRPGDTVVGLGPGAAYGEAKRWLPERFAAVARRLVEENGWKPVVFGGPESVEVGEAICRGLRGRGVNLAAKTTLREAMALLALCGAFVTNDSGLMHVASALDVPLVAIFGSTNDVWTGPLGGGIVLHKHAPCGPCYERTCPTDFRCMKDITVDEVYDAVGEAVAGARAACSSRGTP